MVHSRHGLALMLAVGFAGCAQNTAPTRVATPEPEPTPEPRAVGMADVTLTALNAAKQPVWSVTSKTAKLELDGKKEAFSRLDQVSGKILNAQGLPLKVTGRRGSAQQTKQKLRLEGGVSAEREDVRIDAERLEWWPDAEMLELRGGVALKNAQYSVGSFAALWATSDFEYVGTRDMLMKNPSLKARLATVALATAALASAVTFKDKAGNMVITDLSSWSTRRVDNKTFDFRGAGSPFVGVFKEQGLTVRAKALNGRALDGGKGFFLQRAEFSGGITADVRDREGSVSKLTATTLNWTGTQTQAKAVLGGGVRTEYTLSGGRTLRFEGVSGELDLKLDAVGQESSIRNANFRGPIKVDFREQGKSQWTARGDRMTYAAGPESKLVLTGNVSITGESDAIGGEMTASVVTITLNDKGEVLSIDSEGEPARGTFRDKP